MEWNYAQRHGLRDEVYHVSIPNGIEFYLVACFSLRLSPIASIPNGGNLHEKIKELKEQIEMFQTPTGIEMRNSHIPHPPPFRRILFH
jgi:hypothetical protein